MGLTTDRQITVFKTQRHKKGTEKNRQVTKRDT
jgi:hypothetical protein